MEREVDGDSSSTPPRSVGTSIRHWVGYGWFMSFGTFLPLAVFLGSYLVHLTLVGAPIARSANGFGIWLSTFGQEPPGKDCLNRVFVRRASVLVLSQRVALGETAPHPR